MTDRGWVTAPIFHRTEQMNIVYLVNRDLTDEDFVRVQRVLAITPLLGSIVTEPYHLKVAQKLEGDLMHLFGKSTEDAIQAAIDISTGSDRPIAVIGSFDEAIKEYHADSN